MSHAQSEEHETRARIALLWPKGFIANYSIPLALGYLKSNLEKARYDVRIYDCVLSNTDASSAEVESFLRDFDPDVVGVSTWSPMFPEALALLRLAKNLNPKVHTVIGGAHATSYFDRVMQNPEIDFLFRGEADLSFAVLMDELQNTTPRFDLVKGLVYRKEEQLLQNDMERTPDLDTINIPDYEAIQLETYVKNGYRWNSPPRGNAPLWATRGCPYRCQYCAAPELNGKPVRKHSIEYMVKWVTDLHQQRDARWFNIIDDNFTFDVKYAKAFCRAMIELKAQGVLSRDVGFGTPNGIRMQRGDKELWSLMKQAGWKHLIVAPESGSLSTLKLMKKDLKLEIVPKVVKEIREAGLRVQAFFIIGYPGETPADLEETAKLIRRCRFNFVFLADFHPLPGTPVYDDLVRRGEIEDGLLPNNFSDGQRTYTAKEFENFNFSKFILKMHLYLMLNDPMNIPYHLSVVFKLYSPKIVIKKLFFNIRGMLLSGASRKTESKFVPMHMQAQHLAPKEVSVSKVELVESLKTRD
ncbi:MAG: B12-binding domain-containing radical SAM protein [Gammaproteobacteria bacterium]